MTEETNDAIDVIIDELIDDEDELAAISDAMDMLEDRLTEHEEEL